MNRCMSAEDIVRGSYCVCMQLSAMELRCRSVVSEKNDLEEKLGDMEREKKASEKKIQQVSRMGSNSVK